MLHTEKNFSDLVNIFFLRYLCFPDLIADHIDGTFRFRPPSVDGYHGLAEVIAMSRYYREWNHHVIGITYGTSIGRTEQNLSLFLIKKTRKTQGVEVSRIQVMTA